MKHEDFKNKIEKEVTVAILTFKILTFVCLVVVAGLLYWINANVLAGIVLALAVLYIILIRLDSITKQLTFHQENLLEIIYEVEKIKARKK